MDKILNIDLICSFQFFQRIKASQTTISRTDRVRYFLTSYWAEPSQAMVFRLPGAGLGGDGGGGGGDSWDRMEGDNDWEEATDKQRETVKRYFIFFLGQFSTFLQNYL